MSAFAYEDPRDYGPYASFRNPDFLADLRAIDGLHGLDLTPDLGLIGETDLDELFCSHGKDWEYLCYDCQPWRVDGEREVAYAQLALESSPEHCGEMSPDWHYAFSGGYFAEEDELADVHRQSADSTKRARRQLRDRRVGPRGRLVLRRDRGDRGHNLVQFTGADEDELTYTVPGARRIMRRQGRAQITDQLRFDEFEDAAPDEASLAQAHLILVADYSDWENYALQSQRDNFREALAISQKPYDTLPEMRLVRTCWTKADLQAAANPDIDPVSVEASYSLD